MISVTLLTCQACGNEYVPSLGTATLTPTPTLCVMPVLRNGVAVSVFSPPGRGEQGRFALDVATQCLDFYDDFFLVPYPLPKLDMCKSVCMPCCLSRAIYCLPTCLSACPSLRLPFTTCL